jgi:catechol 2,3-dioxygenase-like lactoylglutathione lyase family enzyme
MNRPIRPKIDCERQHPTLVVRDLPAASAFYLEKLGFEIGFEWGEPPTMAG